VQETGAPGSHQKESIMARPVKHYGKWRIRWIDGHDKSRSQTFDNYNRVVARIGSPLLIVLFWDERRGGNHRIG
jgi:hypothetical protein